MSLVELNLSGQNQIVIIYLRAVKNKREEADNIMT